MKAPSPSHVVVIGAGIVGVSTALWLQRDGCRVTLIDRDGPAEGTSHGNAGVVAACSVVPVPVPGLLKKVPSLLFDKDSPLFLRWGYLPKLLPFLLPYLRRATVKGARETAQHLAPIICDAVEQHQALAADTEAVRWLKLSDYSFAYGSRAGFESDAFLWQLREEQGFTWDVLEGEAVRDFEPALAPDIACLVRVPNHATVTDPGRYVKALANHFEELGGTIRKTTVTGFRRDAARLTAIATGVGDIACDKAVLAAGPWSARLLETLGIKAPLEAERGYHLEFRNANVKPRCPIMVAAGKFVATGMDGRLRCAGVVEFGGLDAPASHAPTDMLRRQVERTFPGLSHDGVIEWMGQRPAPIDSLPFLGEAPDTAGLYCAFGHHHVGLTGGPKTGRLVADLIAGRRNNFDLTPYRVDRFS